LACIYSTVQVHFLMFLMHVIFFSDPSDVSCLLLIEHSYSNASASTTGTNRATTDAAIQTDMTLSDIDKILIDNKNLKEKLDDKDTLFKNIFIEKVTKSDESVRKYTGLPNLIFASIIGLSFLIKLIEICYVRSFKLEAFVYTIYTHSKQCKQESEFQNYVLVYRISSKLFAFLLPVRKFVYSYGSLIWPFFE